MKKRTPITITIIAIYHLDVILIMKEPFDFPYISEPHPLVINCSQKSACTL